MGCMTCMAQFRKMHTVLCFPTIWWKEWAPSPKLCFVLKLSPAILYSESLRELASLLWIAPIEYVGNGLVQKYQSIWPNWKLCCVFIIIHHFFFYMLLLLYIIYWYIVYDITLSLVFILLLTWQLIFLLWSYIYSIYFCSYFISTFFCSSYWGIWWCTRVKTLSQDGFTTVAHIVYKFSNLYLHYCTGFNLQISVTRS